MAAPLANIGPGGVRRRRIVGLLALAAALGGTIVLARGRVSPAWVLALWPLFWLAALGLIQARERT